MLLALRQFLPPLVAVFGIAAAVAAQNPPTPRSAPETTQPATAPAATPVLARVLAVEESCEYLLPGAEDWQRCAVGDEYPPGTVLLTGIQASLKLRIGDAAPYTAVIVDSASQVAIDSALRTADEQRTELGLGFGRIRAGVAEGGLRSSFTIETPVATLSKRGTWDFGIFYERGTQRFEAFLLERGLVDVLNELTQERRGLERGQLVTQAMWRWFDYADMRRTVVVSDLLGWDDVEVVFSQLRQSGLGVIDPSGNRRTLIDLRGSLAQQQFARLIGQQLAPLAALPVLAIDPGPFPRAEGFFGTGRGEQLIPILIQAGSPLAQKGFARPGRYVFPRSALERWLQVHKGRR
jgi:hypothetical protein